MNVDFSKYLAKPDQSIQEHTDHLLEQLAQLVKLGYLEDPHVIDLVKQACLHHDDGKINPMFQNRIRTKEKFNKEVEIPHNVLSGYLLDRNNFVSDEDYYCVMFAIMYHHNYGNPYDICNNNKERIKNLLKDFEIHKLNRNTLNKIDQIKSNPLAITVKGYLHKCDYSASGKYNVEYPNNFLVDSLENVKAKWTEKDIHSDWNELQYFAMNHTNQNVIMIAQTGMGKTEAGLHWIGNHKGYFVLPLRTAINAMYERILKDVLLQENPDNKLSVLHSESLAYYLKNQSNEESHEMNVLEYERKGKRLSIPLNISTMDQLFDFVFQYPGYENKLITFSYSKIVIDEIQMYDPKLLAYLIFGLKKIVEFGGKVAIMTATLSPFIKDLLKAAIPFDDDCIATFTNNLVRHNVKVIDSTLNASDILEKYEYNLYNKKPNKILVVCNRIEKAQKLYTEIIDKGITNVNILHSRFTKKDRYKKEREILEFGKTYDDKGSIDCTSGIWISTSLVEASLDIDFDYLYTELLDLNSLFQRMGRCNRKGVKQTAEYNCFIYLNSDFKYVDEVIYNLSKQAMNNVDGVMTEKDKIDLINCYFTSELIEDSDYYNGSNGYKKTMIWLEGVEPYKYDKNDNKLRDIHTVDIIPDKIYLDCLDEINNALTQLQDSEITYEQRYQYRNEIQQYVVSIPVYMYFEYKNAVKNNFAIKYPEIILDNHAVIPVMECDYDETGFHMLNYSDVIREPNFL